MNLSYIQKKMWSPKKVVFLTKKNSLGADSFDKSRDKLKVDMVDRLSSPTNCPTWEGPDSSRNKSFKPYELIGPTFDKQGQLSHMQIIKVKKIMSIKLKLEGLLHQFENKDLTMV